MEQARPRGLYLALYLLLSSLDVPLLLRSRKVIPPLLSLVPCPLSSLSLSFHTHAHTLSLTLSSVSHPPLFPSVCPCLSPPQKPLATIRKLVIAFNSVVQGDERSKEIKVDVPVYTVTTPAAYNALLHLTLSRVPPFLHKSLPVKNNKVNVVKLPGWRRLKTIIKVFSHTMLTLMRQATDKDMLVILVKTLSQLAPFVSRKSLRFGLALVCECWGGSHATLAPKGVVCVWWGGEEKEEKGRTTSPKDTGRGRGIDKADRHTFVRHTDTQLIVSLCMCVRVVPPMFRNSTPARPCS